MQRPEPPERRLRPSDQGCTLASTDTAHGDQTLWDANEYFQRAMALDLRYAEPVIAQIDAFAHLLIYIPHISERIFA